MLRNAQRFYSANRFSAIMMVTDTAKYLIKHYLYLVPLEIKSKLKYPYLQEQKIENENKRIAEIILKDYSDEVFFNNCPKFGKLARTPKSKQCRFCGYDWH